ncbi:hypothetical protein OCT51_15310 [Halomonas sp. LR3S48]|nr:hypothetical protein OCT51_15310 [Halomonas sp. LR3S48]
MRPWRVVVLVAVLVAGVISAAASHEPYEARLVRLEVLRTLPELAPMLREEPPEVSALFLGFASDQALWMSASLAMIRHGDIARSTLLDYGSSPAFQKVLVRYGTDAVLPVSYFRDHDIATLRARHWLGERYRQASGWLDDEADAEPAMVELTPHRRGQMGIALLETHGYGLLNQFVVSDEGRVEWLQGERVVAGVGDFFTRGLRDLESQWRRGEAIGASDLGWAGLDLLVMASTVKVLKAGRAARGARAGSIEAQGARSGVRQGVVAGGGRFAALPRMVKVAAVAGTAYVLVRHPSLISALGATLAEWLGWPTWLGQFLLWLIVLLPVFVVARLVRRWLLAPLLWLLTPVMRACLGLASRRLAKRAHDTAVAR